MAVLNQNVYTGHNRNHEQSKDSLGGRHDCCYPGGFEGGIPNNYKGAGYWWPDSMVGGDLTCLFCGKPLYRLTDYRWPIAKAVSEGERP